MKKGNAPLSTVVLLALLWAPAASAESPVARTNVTSEAVTLSTYQNDYYEADPQDGHSESLYHTALQACDNDVPDLYYDTGLSPFWAYTYVYDSGNGYWAHKEWSYQWVDIDLSDYTNSTAQKAWLQWTVEKVFWGTTQEYTSTNVISKPLPLNTTSTVYQAFETPWPSWVEYDGSVDITEYISDVSVWVASKNADIQPDPVRPQRTRARTRDPINTISGNVSHDTTDIAVSTPGVPLVFSRAYNSVADYSRHLGPRWTHSYGWALSETNTVFDGETNTWKVVLAGDGAEYRFKVTGAVYEPPFDVNWQLADATNSGYTLTIPPVTVYSFTSNGVLSCIADGAGNAVTMTYTNGTELARAQHSGGLALEFGYAGGNLTSVTSPDATLSMSFAYNASGELTNATRTVAGQGQVTAYSYDAGTNHWLTLRVNPNGDEFEFS